ncbi:MAG: hypothetical protein GF317_05930 [Candidatus Lokiarchaeota archaeon]|nr:hypothetical protein [Candidatus Lokiarchaeota archaeon]
MLQDILEKELAKIRQKNEKIVAFYVLFNDKLHELDKSLAKAKKLLKKKYKKIDIFVGDKIFPLATDKWTKDRPVWGTFPIKTKKGKALYHGKVFFIKLVLYNHFDVLREWMDYFLPHIKDKRDITKIFENILFISYQVATIINNRYNHKLYDEFKL